MAEDNQTKIWFIADNGKRIPFSEFLLQQKQERKLSWEGMNELCGIRVTSYAHNISNGQPNNPILKRFRKIVDALGFREEQFETTDLFVAQGCGRVIVPERGSEEFQDTLRAIGDYTLRLNDERSAQGKRLQRLSVPYMKKLASGEIGLMHVGFTARYGRSSENLLALLRDLHSLDPKYQIIEYHPQSQADPRYWTDEENQALGEVMGFIGVDLEGDNTPGKNVWDFVLWALERRGVSRSKDQIWSRIRSIRNQDRRPNHVVNGSPTVNTLEDELSKTIEELREDGLGSVLDETGDTEELRSARRRNYFRYASPGHQALVYYLSDSENYQRLIGKDARLVRVDLDFDKGSFERNIPGNERSRLEGINSLEDLADEGRALDFVKDWQRCDMIFWREDRQAYEVIEVKQNARIVKDFEGNDFDNGEKGCEQLDSYTAVILGKIRRRNRETSSSQDLDVKTRPLLNESVDGTLAAYELSDRVRDYLIIEGGRRGLVVDREEVQEYVKSKLGVDIYGRSVSEDRQDLDEISRVETVPIRRGIAFSERDPRVDISKSNNFRELQAVMEDGVQRAILLRSPDALSLLEVTDCKGTIRKFYFDRPNYRRTLNRWLNGGKLVEKDADFSVDYHEDFPI